MTRAPSAKNRSAMARPIPCPAAVTNESLLSSRPATLSSPVLRAAAREIVTEEAVDLGERHAVGQAVKMTVFGNHPGCTHKARPRHPAEGAADAYPANP